MSRFTRTCVRLGILLSIHPLSPGAQQFVPDHDRTPGGIDPGITQENIADTICVPKLHEDSPPGFELHHADLKRSKYARLRDWLAGNRA